MLRLMGMCGVCNQTGMITMRHKKDNILVMEDPDWTFDRKMLVHKKCEPSITDKLVRSLYDKEDVQNGVGKNGNGRR